MGCSPSDENYRVYATLPNPVNNRLVTIEKAQSVLAYGPETIRVYVKQLNASERVHRVTTKISNDGGEVSDENIQLTWKGEYRLSLCLSGDEQDDKLLEIDVEEKSFTETTMKCKNRLS